jgi:hypothetical protein
MPAKKYALVLAAGFGTRMGSIGNKLPKVMWPIFEKSLLEIQVQFARELGYQEIYVNLFHQADEILKRTKNLPAFQNVIWLREEPEILDIGGGIHNLARRPEVNYEGELLVLNADQFLWFTSSDLVEWRKNNSGSDAILLTWMVNSSDGYNRLDFDKKGRFEGITINKNLPRNIEICTYSGNALINLASLNKISGPSKFFESVCPPTNIIKGAQLPVGNYWDFGTATRYWSSMSKIMQRLSEKNYDAFLRFLEKIGGIDQSKINPVSVSYNCNTPNLIHLGSGVAPIDHPAGVVLSGDAIARSSEECLVFEGEVQRLV